MGAVGVVVEEDVEVAVAAVGVVVEVGVLVEVAVEAVVAITTMKILRKVVVVVGAVGAVVEVAVGAVGAVVEEVVEAVVIVGAINEEMNPVAFRLQPHKDAAISINKALVV